MRNLGPSDLLEPNEEHFNLLSLRWHLRIYIVCFVFFFNSLGDSDAQLQPTNIMPHRKPYTRCWFYFNKSIVAPALWSQLTEPGLKIFGLDSLCKAPSAQQRASLWKGLFPALDVVPWCKPQQRWPNALYSVPPILGRWQKQSFQQVPCRYCLRNRAE